jgi:hypothetical protein
MRRKKTKLYGEACEKDIFREKNSKSTSFKYEVNIIKRHQKHRG